MADRRYRSRSPSIAAADAGAAVDDVSRGRRGDDRRLGGQRHSASLSDPRVSTTPDPTTISARVHASLRDVPDFPRPGILFKDITPMLADPALMRNVIADLAAAFGDGRVDRVVGVESRGFLFGLPVALALNAKFSPARKPGKLPWHTVQESYALEYREDAIEMHQDAVVPGERVLIVDDVLATGGTAGATARLIARLGAQTIGLAVAVELGFLGGRSRLDPIPVHATLSY